MKSTPRIGTETERTFTVAAEHAIDFPGENMPRVLSTPWLLSFLEQTAREALRPFLEPGESSVGVEVELQHLAPTPIGHVVTCRARITHVDGPRIGFQLEAHDERDPIARAFHRRHVVRVERFARAVQSKTKPVP